MNDFVKALTHKHTQKEIVATFVDNTQATYTMSIYNLLTSDPATLRITDKQTGELLYIKGEQL